jgi:uncharacterized protein CbrC (UPF0167 family)
MKELIEALQTFAMYTQTKWPTHCEHDVLMICDVGRDTMSAADQDYVEERGFLWSDEHECWISFRFGSA